MHLQLASLTFLSVQDITCMQMNFTTLTEYTQQWAKPFIESGPALSMFSSRLSRDLRRSLLRPKPRQIFFEMNDCQADAESGDSPRPCVRLETTRCVIRRSSRAPRSGPRAVDCMAWATATSTATCRKCMFVFFLLLLYSQSRISPFIYTLLLF